MEANYVHKDSTTLVQDKLVKNELNQQKEFIKYLEEKLNFYKINTQGYSMNLVEEILQEYKRIIGYSEDE